MKIKPGYKQTEVGVIPKDWEVKTLGELGSTYGGLTGKTKADFGVGKGQYITFMNVMSNVVIDCAIFGQVNVAPTESQNRVVKGDLLFNGSSETPEEVAMCAILAADVPNLFLNSFCFGFRFRDGAEADGLFISYYLRSKEGRELIKSIAQGSTRYNMSKSALLKAPLCLPSLSEQTAIAAALSDVDALLDGLDRLIAKKRAIKLATMQQLLTGKTRLPGFHGEWETKHLGEIVDIATGQKNVNTGNTSGKYPFFTCSRERTFSDNYSFDTEAILIAGNGDVGNLHYYSGKFEAYQRTYVLSQFASDVRYIWHQLNYRLVRSLNIGKIGTSIPYIKKGDLTGFAFPAPPTEAEQTAIAAVLSDMDDEIAALEVRRDKTRALKYAMMGELLTGKIRLVTPKQKNANA